MSVSDLKKLGLLRKESDWDAKHTRSFVPLIMWLVTAVSAIAGCIMLVLGDGGVITWIGLVVFSIAMVGFVLMNIASVDRALQHDTDDATD